LRPPAPAGGLFAALRTRIGKKLGFTAIRAMLRPRDNSKLLGTNAIFNEVAEFCGFSRVNMI
jgi:hypothetical protein